jgi:hypothetical protein
VGTGVYVLMSLLTGARTEELRALTPCGMSERGTGSLTSDDRTLGYLIFRQVLGLVRTYRLT